MHQMYSTRFSQSRWPLLFFLVLLGLTFAAYWPGLGGSFLLDDWGTLPKLGAYGPVDNFTTFISYITSGTSGPSGRPLALLSFLIDAHNWPASPWPFKLTNVLLQLINGCVLAWLLAQLGRAYGLASRRALWAAVLGAGIWMIHPFFVSTTLYVVQRMAMLAAFFVMSGLALYVTGRRRMADGRIRSGYALMIGGLAGGTLLGFFSKENAALLPLLALVLEVTVLAQQRRQLADDHAMAWSAPQGEPPPPPHWLFKAIFLWLPSALITGYLLWQLRSPEMLSPGRDFSIFTRLLTESRVLVRYLYYLLIPHAWTHGLYTAIPVSQNILHPWTTLPSILLIAGLVVGAFTVRHRWPVLAAAVLFFFAGQLLESTTLPLELYYEHRNYLPAILLFWPLALWFVSGRSSRALRGSALVLTLILLLALTGLRANLWGHPQQLALTWMKLNPNSSRAVATEAETLESEGKYLQAYLRLYAASKLHPSQISFALPRIEAACKLGGARPSDVDALVYAAGHDISASHLLYRVLSPEIGNPALSCKGFGNDAMMRVVNSALNNPHFRNNHAVHQQMNLLRGQIFLAQHHPQQAYKAFSDALELNPTPDVALTATAYLLDAKQPLEARKLLQKYRTLPKHLPPIWTMAGLHRRWLDTSDWYGSSFHRMRQAIRHALNNSGKHRGKEPSPLTMSRIKYPTPLPAVSS